VTSSSSPGASGWEAKIVFTPAVVFPTVKRGKARVRTIVTADHLEDDLGAAQKAGVMRQVDLALTARYIVGGVEKLVLTALAGDSPVNLEAIVDAAVELELFGLLKEEVPQ